MINQIGPWFCQLLWKLHGCPWTFFLTLKRPLARPLSNSMCNGLCHASIPTATSHRAPFSYCEGPICVNIVLMLFDSFPSPSKSNNRRLFLWLSERLSLWKHLLESTLRLRGIREFTLSMKQALEKNSGSCKLVGCRNRFPDLFLEFTIVGTSWREG